jgi:hypothetical protein
LRKIRLTSALNIVGQQDSSEYARERLSELALAYLNLDPLIMKDLNSLKQYYHKIYSCLEQNQIYTEARVKDSLGESMFYYKSGFCVVSDEQCSLELNVL